MIIGCTTRPYNMLPLAEAFRRIAAAGYTDVAVFRNQGSAPITSESSDADVGAVRQMALDAGLSPSMMIGRTQLGLGLAEAIADYCNLIDRAALLGVSLLLDCGTSNEAHYDAYVELMRECAPHAEQQGISITMKPHGGISLTCEHLAGVFEKVAHPAFGICFDPGNILYYTTGKQNPATDLEKIVPLTNMFIVKDCVVEDAQADVNVTAGDGLVDFPRLFETMISGGFRGPVYVECVGSKEPDGVDRDAAFTLGYVKGILQTCLRSA